MPSDGILGLPIVSEAWDKVRERAQRNRGGPWLREYEADPARFIRRELKQTLWKGQRYIAKALIKHRMVVHRSAKKTGKTHGAGGILLSMMASAPCRAICLAPTHRQVRELLWAGVRTQYARAANGLPGEMFTAAYRVDNDCYALAFATDEPDRVQGFHAGVKPVPDYEEGELDDDEDLDLLEPSDLERFLDQSSDRRLFWLLDEAPGIKPVLWPIIEGSLQGENVYALVQGNPTRARNDPHFFCRLLQPGSGWHRVWTSGAEVPEGLDVLGADATFTAPPWLVDPDWVEKSRKHWGADSPLFHALVLGIPADTGEDGVHVVSADLLEAAASRGEATERGAHIGADLARSGKDSIAFSLQIDGVKRDESLISTKSLDPLTLTMDLVTRLEAQRARWQKAYEVEIPWENVHLDGGGLGGPICDRLRQKGAFVDAVDFGSGPVGDWEDLVGEDLQFLNRRAELHWIERRALEEGAIYYPPEWETTWNEATWATYELRQDRKGGTMLVVAPKDKIRDRYGRSPDTHDADLLALSRQGGNLPSFGVI